MNSNTLQFCPSWLEGFVVYTTSREVLGNEYSDLAPKITELLGSPWGNCPPCCRAALYMLYRAKGVTISPLGGLNLSTSCKDLKNLHRPFCCGSCHIHSCESQQ